MVWFFERDGAFLRCETREVDMGTWELVLVDADGRECVERFADQGELVRRERALLEQLRSTGWCGPHGRLI
jgi:hypothetical protein